MVWNIKVFMNDTTVQSCHKMQQKHRPEETENNLTENSRHVIWILQLSGFANLLFIMKQNSGEKEHS